MYLLERRGLALLDRSCASSAAGGSFVLLVLVLVPGFGVQVNGARRWFALGPIQFQPSELMKIALVLYVARYLADHPKRMRGFRQAVAPIAVAGRAGEPADRGRAGPGDDAGGGVHRSPRCCSPPGCRCATSALLGGDRGRRGAAAGAGPALPAARLTSFLHPWASATAAGAGYQAVQGQIALGSGGLLGVGLGKSVQKIYYLPEAQTDFILAVIGEELGVLGIFGVVVLYGMIAYAGLRTARRAVGRYAKLLATGLTSLILCQGILNIFVVLGMAPLTGVPLPVHLLRAHQSVRDAGVRRAAAQHLPAGGRRLKVVEGSTRAPTQRDAGRRRRADRRAGE